jgi:hypothetical protein
MWWSARRGFRVLTLDRFEAHHARGSSHGRDRIVRTGTTDCPRRRALVKIAEHYTGPVDPDTRDGELEPRT